MAGPRAGSGRLRGPHAAGSKQQSSCDSPLKPIPGRSERCFQFGFANAVISMFLNTNPFSLLTASAARKLSIGTGCNTRSPGANSDAVVGLRQRFLARQWPCCGGQGVSIPKCSCAGDASAALARACGPTCRRKSKGLVPVLPRNAAVKCDWLEKPNALAISAIGFMGVWRNEPRAISSRSSTTQGCTGSLQCGPRHGRAAATAEPR